jgi:hypothetical protein
MQYVTYKIFRMGPRYFLRKILRQLSAIYSMKITTEEV